MADVGAHKFVLRNPLLFFSLSRICLNDLSIKSMMLILEICIDIKKQDHPGQRSVKLRQCGVIGFHGWLALQTFRQRSDQEVIHCTEGSLL